VRINKHCIFFKENIHSPVEMKGYKKIVNFSDGLTGIGFIVTCSKISDTGILIKRGPCPHFKNPERRRRKWSCKLKYSSLLSIFPGAGFKTL
jgi:hypothetical protein